MTIPVNGNNGKVLPWFRSNAALIVILVSVGISIGRNWQRIDALKADLAVLRTEVAALNLLLESRSTSAEASETGRRLLQKIDGIEAQSDRNYRLIVEIQDELRRQKPR